MHTKENANRHLNKYPAKWTQQHEARCDRPNLCALQMIAVRN